MTFHRTFTLRARRLGAPGLIALCVAALPLAAPPAFAYSPSTPGQTDESDLDSHRTYQNSDGRTVHSPARSNSGRVPEGASARCRDGAYSFSRHRRGTCSGHGGVAAWL